MKRIVLAMMLSMALTSCVVSDPYQPDPLNDRNIAEFCDGVFENDVKANVECFYHIYYAARFLQADAAQKVSVKYDNIRTGLRRYGDSYAFASMDFSFSKEDPFTVGSMCKVRKNYSRDITITMTSENEWKIDAETDDVIILLTLISVDDTGMKMNLRVRGKWTEESSYSAKFESESLDVEIVNKTPIAIDKSCYSGVISFDFFDNQTLILERDMTLRASD